MFDWYLNFNTTDTGILHEKTKHIRILRYFLHKMTYEVTTTILYENIAKNE